MKTILALLTLSLVLTACRRQDTSLSSQIIGTWPSSGANWTNTTIYNPDGSFSIEKQKQGESQSSVGTWKIDDGFLTMTFTNSSITGHNSPVGMTERYHIIHLDSHELQMEDVVPIVQTIKR
jgi:hypothetical protein